jgi:tetratricopeptide (TPR) repeat protein
LQAEFPEAANNLGLALQGQGRPAEAAEHFRLALRLRPDFAMAHNNLGTALRELGQPESALDCFRRAVELDPGLAPARANLGQLLLDRGQPAEALPHCQEAVRLQPDLPAAHNNLGNTLRALDRLTEAKVAYTEALRLDANLAQTHANLARVLRQEGQPGEAVTSGSARPSSWRPTSPPYWGAVLPVAVHEVRYEETVADLEGVARRLVAACGLDWEPACLRFHEVRRPVRTASITQVRQPIYRRSVARWKHYEGELAALFERPPAE